MMFSFLNTYAWLVFALCSVAFLWGAVTLMWHIHESRSGRYVLVLVVAGVLMGVGFALGGMQAGPNPVVAREVTIPWVRAFWLAGSGLAMVFLGVYWLRRMRWGWRRDSPGLSRGESRHAGGVRG